MPPSRRGVLRTTGAFLAAMLAGYADVGAPAGEPDELTAEDIAFTIDLDSQFTDDHPAHLTMTLKNTGEAWLEFSYGPVLFSRFRSQPGGLFLVPDDRSHIATMTAAERDGPASFVPNDPIDGCWRRPNVSWMVHPIALVAKLGPGDVIRAGYISCSLRERMSDSGQMPTGSSSRSR